MAEATVALHGRLEVALLRQKLQLLLLQLHLLRTQLACQSVVLRAEVHLPLCQVRATLLDLLQSRLMFHLHLQLLIHAPLIPVPLHLHHLIKLALQLRLTLLQLTLQRLQGLCP